MSPGSLIFKRRDVILIIIIILNANHKFIYEQYGTVTLVVEGRNAFFNGHQKNRKNP